MARAFSERERAIIRKALLDKGRELFAKFGLEKTGIRDLAREAGIAPGTFYLFFSSKELLFWEIIEEEEQKLKQKLLAQVSDVSQLTVDDFREFVKKSLAEVAKNPILQVLYTDDYWLLARKLPEQRLIEHQEQDVLQLLPLLQVWQDRGEIVNVDLPLLANVLRGLFLLTLHKREIGQEHFAETLNLMVDLIFRGLQPREREAND